jgi:hypothetical protein
MAGAWDDRPLGICLSGDHVADGLLALVVSAGYDQARNP